MKIRTNFISNSSSSSFILSTPKDKVPKIKIVLELDIANDLTDTRVITDVESLNSYFDFEYSYAPGKQDNYDWAKDMYDSCLKEIKAGKQIVIGEVGNDDGNPVESLLFKNGFEGYVKDQKDITVIKDCEQ